MLSSYCANFLTEMVSFLVLQLRILSSSLGSWSCLFRNLLLLGIFSQYKHTQKSFALCPLPSVAMWVAVDTPKLCRSRGRDMGVSCSARKAMVSALGAL